MYVLLGDIKARSGVWFPEHHFGNCWNANCDLDVQLQNKLRLTLESVGIIKNQSDVVRMQVKLYTDNQESFGRQMGQDAYVEKIIDLVGKLYNPVRVMW